VLGHDIPIGIVTCYGLDDSGLETTWGEENFSPPCQSTPAMGPTQPLLVHWKPSLFLEAKWLGCSINEQPTPSIDIKNGWSCACTDMLWCDFHKTCYNLKFGLHLTF